MATNPITVRVHGKDHRLDSLPRWAQTLFNERQRIISDLTMLVEALRGEPAALAYDFEEQVAVLDPFHRNVPLGEGHVQYTLPSSEGSRAERTIRVQYQNGQVEVSSGWRGIRLNPVSSNVVLIGINDD